VTADERSQGRPPGLRTVLAGLVVTLMVALVASPALGADADSPLLDESAEAQLVDRFAPVVMLRSYDKLCAATGEPYVPMTVDAVLDNPEVALRQVGNADAVIAWGPGADDLYGLGSGTYLDLPGDSLNPGCTYARYQAAYAPLARAAVYAHVATQQDRPGYVAVQYWFYWYYNDWNDRHESDWEFIQVLFEADDAQQALAGEPVGVGYAQHEGGEVHAWNSPGLEREGSHPVVYPSQGSHASYFAPALYLGRGASEGFGCDNTEAPSTAVEPRIVLLPDRPTGSADPSAWLGYQGRWGERHSGPNNGPDGPYGKPRWHKPVTWQEGLRPSSFEIPGGSDAPPAVIGAFCSVVDRGSQVYLSFAASPSRVLLVLGLLVVGVGLVLRRTSWSRVPALPIVRRRRAGEALRAATRLYRRRPVAFLTIGLLTLPVGVIGSLASAVLAHLPYVGRAVTVSIDRGDPLARALIAVGVGAGLWPVTVVLVCAAVAHLLQQGEQTDARWTARSGVDAIAEVVRRIRDLASAFVLAALAIVVLQLSGIGVPIAAWLSVRYQFVGQVVMVEGRRSAPALARSASLVRLRWWHTACLSFVVWAGVHALGVLLGLLGLLLVPGLSLWAVTLLVLVAEIALTPLGALVLTLLYGDAVAEHDRSPETSRAGV
jgi:hypothetical protein